MSLKKSRAGMIIAMEFLGLAATTCPRIFAATWAGGLEQGIA
jgi:hypothetical protein